MNNQSITSYVDNYLDEVKALLDCVPRGAMAEAVQILHQARMAGIGVYIMGNGGSSATAAHMVNDLNKLAIVPGKPRFRAICLSDNTPLFSAWANDDGYAQAFAEQLRNFLRAGDVVVGISGSGNSANVLEAMKLARQERAMTIGITGFDGGDLKDLVDCCILVPCDCMTQVEDLHMVLEHVIASALRDLADTLA